MGSDFLCPKNSCAYVRGVFWPLDYVTFYIYFKFNGRKTPVHLLCIFYDLNLTAEKLLSTEEHQFLT